MEFNREELLICALARMLTDCRSVAAGNSSPIPGAAALLAEAALDVAEQSPQVEPRRSLLQSLSDQWARRLALSLPDLLAELCRGVLLLG